MHAYDLPLELVAKPAIERAQWFIQQQGARAVHHGTCQGHALLLTARQLFGEAVGEGFEVYQGQCFVDPAGDLGFRHSALFQGEGDVPGDGHVREQRVVLEDDAEVPLVGLEPGDIVTVDEYRAFGQRDEARDHRQQRGFS